MPDTVEQAHIPLLSVDPAQHGFAPVLARHEMNKVRYLLQYRLKHASSKEPLQNQIHNLIPELRAAV